MRISYWSSDVWSSDLFAQPALAQFSKRISKDSSHVLRKRQYFGHLHKEIERSVVINDASDRRRQFSHITLGHRCIPISAHCNAYQRVIDVGDNGVHIQLPRTILPGLFDPVAEATADRKSVV